MGASLADGTIEGNTVVCSWHGWAYDADTGQSSARPWACTPVYDVKVEGDDVLVRKRSEP
jgi:nitrite reductase/ring-hydroxylating ferredoxin subunit